MKDNIQGILFICCVLFPMAAIVVLLYSWAEAFIKNKYIHKHNKK